MHEPTKLIAFFLHSSVDLDLDIKSMARFNVTFYEEDKGATMISF